MDPIILNSILDSMSDSLIVIGDQGRVLYANKAAGEMLGYPPTFFMKHGIAPLFLRKHENYEFNRLFVDAVLKKSVNEYSEVDYFHPDGSKRRLAATTSYLLEYGEDQTAFVGFVALFKDITEVSELRRKEAAWINERERIAGEKFQSLYKLAMGVAHEIRNPVVSIGGFASRIVKGKDSQERQRESAEKILDEARRLEATVQEVQDYCNLPPAVLAEHDIASLFESAVSDTKEYADERNIHVRYEVTEGTGSRVFLDQKLMGQALALLIENAADFSYDGGIVTLKAAIDDRTVTIEITDEGAGIDRENLPFILDPFFSTRAKGSGMGLAIVERVVQEHYGQIDVDSEVGMGTTVRLILPKAPPHNLES